MHTRTGQTESQVDPSFQLASPCESVWPGLREIYFSSVIEDNHGNQRVLFQAINSLLHKKAELRYPSTCSDTDLADQFNSFFKDKIRLIREGLPQPITDAAYSTIPSMSCQCELTSFERVSTTYIKPLFSSPARLSLVHWILSRPLF